MIEWFHDKTVAQILDKEPLYEGSIDNWNYCKQKKRNMQMRTYTSIRIDMTPS